MRGPQTWMIWLLRHLNRRGITLTTGFQCFLAGGISALCALVTLFFLGRGTTEDWPVEILALITLATLGVGLAMMLSGYLIIMTLRLGRFLLEGREETGSASSQNCP